MKGKPPGGPTTRSRSNVTATDKAPEKAKEKEKTSILVENPAQLMNLPPTEGIGSMAAYIAMRERQKKEDLQKNVAVAGEGQSRNEAIDAVDGENVLPDTGLGEEQG